LVLIGLFDAHAPIVACELQMCNQVSANFYPLIRTRQAAGGR
jgi:hypothetical protein